MKYYINLLQICIEFPQGDDLRLAGKPSVAPARLEKIGAFALTEPEHGSDSVSLETTASPDGESYVISGHKKRREESKAASE